MSNRNTLLRLGAVGTVAAALGCFTPVVAVVLGVLGLYAFAGYLDYVLYPALAFFVALTLFALRRKRRGEPK